MFVRKFEGDTLDETLKAVKRELGPDAIILKTVTNKGLKGAFKKKRIEITAAISEQNYTKKAKVDRVLSDDQRENFYQSPAEEVNRAINNYNETPQTARGGYGSLGLNKVVNTVSQASKKIQNSLDDFLTTPEEEEETTASPRVRGSFDQFISESSPQLTKTQSSSPVYEATSENYPTQDEGIQRELEMEKRRVNEVSATLGGEIKSQKHQIELLEKKLFELTERLSEAQGGKYEEPQGLRELRTTLRSLELEENIVQKIVKKANFELTPEDLSDSDSIYEFALRELNELVHVGMPYFSRSEAKQPVTALISESTCGQASMALKLAVLQDNVQIIRFRQREIDQGKSDFTSRIFKLKISEVSSLSHLMAEARKAREEGKTLLLDLRLDFKEENETKKFIETLRRSFDQIEFIVTLSAIHSEIYNRKILSKYKSFVNGATITHIDQCLSFGALFNAHNAYNEVPLMFYSTGAIVPDDIESATAERLLAGMFQL
ncbi:MAG: hypothetical protein CME62_01055 [Halobacteriovoraceae bacterium]|nr:hypothetical protein [Halobacteriovoraceae bacterium]|tara:strand:+ start:8873 stop:10348 length:1476 start_codon:yes stop_codon:yes gene_type:complete